LAHEAVTVLGTIERGRVTLSLADIGGTCWLFGLSAGLEGPYSDVIAVIEEAEGIARKCGYKEIYADTSIGKMARCSKRYGYEVKSVVLEKKL
jgi:hypothetical protein